MPSRNFVCKSLHIRQITWSGKTPWKITTGSKIMKYKT